MKNAKRCIIHFGLHKTGSTSIQQFLRRRLNDQAFFYPESGHEPHLRDDCHNRVLVAAFRASPEQYYAHAKEGASRVVLWERGNLFKKQLQNWAKEEGARTLILSAEELSNFESDEVQTMARFLRHFTSEISGIGYVRKYKKLQESRFQQSLRMPSLKRRLLPPEHDRFASFPYKQKIETLLQVLGPEALTVRKFDRSSLEEGCVVRDFCSQAGISQESGVVEPVNRSLSLDAVRFLYAYRKLNQGAFAQKYTLTSECLLSQKLSELIGPRAAFHSTLLTQSAHRWREDVNWISDFFGEDMLGELFADDDKPCIRSEADLLCFSVDSLEWLAQEARVPSSKLMHAAPEVVANAVGILHDKIMARLEEQHGFVAQTKGYLNRLFKPYWKNIR